MNYYEFQDFIDEQQTMSTRQANLLKGLHSSENFHEVEQEDLSIPLYNILYYSFRYPYRVTAVATNLRKSLRNEFNKLYYGIPSSDKPSVIKFNENLIKFSNHSTILFGPLHSDCFRGCTLSSFNMFLYKRANMQNAIDVYEISTPHVTPQANVNVMAINDPKPQ